MNAPAQLERRQHDRLKLFNEEAAVLFGANIGPIIEMSSSGFSAQCTQSDTFSEEECSTNIIVKGCTVIPNIPIKFEWIKDNKHSDEKTSTVGVKFKKLTSSQKLKIAALLKWHTED